MITVYRTFDYELVKRIVTHPKIYPHVSDDSSPKPEDWKPIESDAVWYVLVENSSPAGVFTLVPQNAVCYEVHTCLLPRIWGPVALDAAGMMLEFMFSKSPCRRVVTNVPDYNRVALRFATNSGLKVFGLNPKSYLKNGTLFDQIMLGISKEEVCR